MPSRWWPVPCGRSAAAAALSFRRTRPIGASIPATRHTSQHVPSQTEFDPNQNIVEPAERPAIAQAPAALLSTTNHVPMALCPDALTAIPPGPIFGEQLGPPLCNCWYSWQDRFGFRSIPPRRSAAADIHANMRCSRQLSTLKQHEDNLASSSLAEYASRS